MDFFIWTNNWSSSPMAARSTFVGALAYADDIVLICPTPSALHLLLKLCDDFACEYDVIFNANKSKLLICSSSKQCKVVRDIKGRPFHIGGISNKLIVFSHLGHIITPDFSDTEDIRYRRTSYVTDLWDRSILFVFFQ